jgi:hypothetical protein
MSERARQKRRTAAEQRFDGICKLCGKPFTEARRPTTCDPCYDELSGMSAGLNRLFTSAGHRDLISTIRGGKR